MKKRLPMIFSFLVLILAIFIKSMNFSIVEQLQLKVFDSFQVNHPRQYQPLQVKIIDIDDESLSKIGQWPWPRNKLAQLVDKLTEAGVSAIVMDILFAEDDRTSPDTMLKLWGQSDKIKDIVKDLPNHDDIFADSLSKSNVAIGLMLTDEKNARKALRKAGFSYAGDDPRGYIMTFNGVIPPLEKFENSVSGLGAFNSTPDADGIMRKLPLVFISDGDFYPSLSAEALRIAQGASTYIIKSSGASGEESYGQQTGVVSVKVGDIEIPTNKSGKFWIYYTEYNEDRYVPAWKVLSPDFDMSFLEGYIVYLGTSAAGLKDIRSTPMNPTASGVEVHVQAVEQILTGEFLSRPDWIDGAEIVIMVIVGIILIVVMEKLSAVWGAVFTFVILLSSVAFSWHSFVENRILIDPVTPGIAIILLYLSGSLSRFISSEKERRQVKNAFSHYMSPALVAQLAANPEKLVLGGETKNVTLLFCDIRGFTTISEKFDAHHLTKFINRFLTPMTTIILNRKGTIDKYMGDCIMAFWNAPLDDDEHARNACLASLEMVSGLIDLNDMREKEAKELGINFMPIKIGIGLNTGDCCVGNMGSDQRFDYSVLGDDVNLASRLEGQSKTYGIDIVIGENTYKNVTDLATIELDLIQVKGKTEPVRIYTLLGNEDMAQNNEFKSLKRKFTEALEAYRGRDWKNAKSLLKECEGLNKGIKEFDLQGLFDLYKERIKVNMKAKLPQDWDGVFIATSK